jgi:iron complex outermembrane recepter protein
MPAAYAQERTAATGGLEEVVVTATKRAESLQDVPLSIQALGGTKLAELHVDNVDDYIKFLPSVSYTSFGPGFAHIYMRGVSSGGLVNHSGPLPSVGVYLDEQPITTIDGPLDVHVYDIARVEALAGPQGTLYGASSQAGTLRIITNKPDPKAFAAGYDIDANTVAHGDSGFTLEGYVNLPLTSTTAIRLVGWDEHDGGFINNVPGTLTYPSTGFTLDNSAIAKKKYNPSNTKGARAALKIDLNDNWSITPQVMAQHTSNNGIFAFDPTKGDLNVSHFYPENADDRWVDAALTVEGKIGNWDLTYAGAFLRRHDETHSDYTDYSLGYDIYSTYSHYVVDAAGNPLANFSQTILGKDHYMMLSHELRVSSPKEYRFRAVGGLFLQHQEHDILQDYFINGLGPQVSVTGFPNTWWLTDEVRINRDYAAFTELSFEITPNLTATGGIRYFEAKNSLQGFYGFGATNDFTSSTGEKSCFATPGLNGGPCENVDKLTDEKGTTPKLNLSYKFDKQRMVYVTWSRGFRPGGINRVGSLPPYKADYLTNTEFGWKTSWLENRLRFNGAVFYEKWKDFQFAFLGPNSVTQIANAGQATIKGVESELDWAVSGALTLSGALAYTDARLAQDYCGGQPTCTPPIAPSGEQLPTTPRFKGNVIARYAFGVGDIEAHLQGAFVYQSQVWEDLRTVERNIIGPQRAYGVADFSAGIAKNGLSVELYLNNAFDRRGDIYSYAECTEAICGPVKVYHYTNHPRTIGLKFGQKF